MKRLTLAAVAIAFLAGCSDADSHADKERWQAAKAAAAGEAEPHDRSAFATDPRQVHVGSPDEDDMHPRIPALKPDAPEPQGVAHDADAG